MKLAKPCVYAGVQYSHLSDDSRELDSHTLFVRTPLNAAFTPDHPSIEAKQLAGLFAPLPKIIGITGTNGKTTTAALIYSLLLDCGYSCALIGTRGVFANDKQLRPKGLTTPCALELYEIFAMVGECEFVVMEVSSHAIVQERIAGISFHTKILTNITSDHLDYHKTQAEYIRVKNSFFSDECCKIINADEPKASYNPLNSHTYGIESSANLRPNAYSLDQAITAHLSYTPSRASQSSKSREQALIHAPLYGKHNLYNILAALLCVRLIAQKPLESCVEHLENFGGVEGRMEVVSKEPLIIVDFAHTHDGMEAIFESFRGKNIAVVFGAGGDRDPSKRPKMGAVAYKYAKRIYITSDNPRSEKPESIIEAIRQGIPLDTKTPIICEVDRAKAICQAVSELEDDWVLLVLGKGDETYQIIGSESRHFDDREEIRKALKARI